MKPRIENGRGFDYNGQLIVTIGRRKFSVITDNGMGEVARIAQNGDIFVLGRFESKMRALGWILKNGHTPEALK